MRDWKRLKGSVLGSENKRLKENRRVQRDLEEPKEIWKNSKRLGRTQRDQRSSSASEASSDSTLDDGREGDLETFIKGNQMQSKAINF